VTEPYSQGGYIPGEPTEWRVEVGERVIRASDWMVLELQAVEGGFRWVEIGVMPGPDKWLGELNRDEE
jgi:hypothetical protein